MPCPRVSNSWCLHLDEVQIAEWEPRTGKASNGDHRGVAQTGALQMAHNHLDLGVQP